MLLQTTGFPIPPSLSPVLRDTGASGHTPLTHASRGRGGVVWDYGVRTDTKPEQDKTNTQTATSVGLLLHPPFFFFKS